MLRKFVVYTDYFFCIHNNSITTENKVDPSYTYILICIYAVRELQIIKKKINRKKCNMYN